MEKSDSPKQKHKSTKKDKKKSGNDENFESVHQIHLNAPKECPVTDVIIYNDRAEVTRSVVIELNSGVTEIIVSGLSHKIDKDSIRVAGGRGQATILEVSYSVSYSKPKEETNEKKIENKIRELQDHIDHYYQEVARIQKEKEWIDNWAPSVLLPRSPEIFTPDLFEKTNKVLSFYTHQQECLDEQVTKIEDQVKELEKEKGILQKQVGTQGQNLGLHEVIIMLQATVTTKCELQLAYIVYGASWEALYDVRLISQEKDKLEVIYYGNIINSSGEDWIDSHLTLSTATPSVAGKPPNLITKWLRLKNKERKHIMVEKSITEKRESMTLRDEGSTFATAPITVATTTATAASFTTFIIPRKATIQSDNKPHRVIIKALDKLEATFHYSITPSESQYAYLKATLRNTNDFPLLAGDINVFMDSSFVAKSTVDVISPNESFGIYLGIDSSIKVEYRISEKSAAFGVFSKTKSKECNFMTVITNNKSKPVDIVLMQQFPKSTDSSLKVRLVKPEIPTEPVDVDIDTKTPIALTTSHNIRWQFPINQGEKVEIDYTYVIEHPLDKDYI